MVVQSPPVSVDGLVLLTSFSKSGHRRQHRVRDGQPRLRARRRAGSGHPCVAGAAHPAPTGRCRRRFDGRRPLSGAATRPWGPRLLPLDARLLPLDARFPPRGRPRAPLRSSLCCMDDPGGPLRSSLRPWDDPGGPWRLPLRPMDVPGGALRSPLGPLDVPEGP
jgi:hypothetical protein